ncbi:lycopene cyclase domain-containing protein [Flavobacteriaceae bacterium F08102]|nr:lycopene cyclase domain-containing protein [Flavobacteriaceae bacterium F08102]
MKYTYLLINLGCIMIPLLASFYPKFPFYKHWKSFIKANFIVAFIFVIWDSYFVQLGIWGFNEQYLTGVMLGNLPIEEVLFFVCIPYCCVFSFYALTILVKSNHLKMLAPYITGSLVVGGAILVLIHVDRAYTWTTFLATALCLGWFLVKKVQLQYYYLTYIFILPFFLLSNGLLTGYGMEEPVVWYNDTENLGIRVLTIPLEDFSYGMVLIFLNIYLFQRFKQTYLDRKRVTFQSRYPKKF